MAASSTWIGLITLFPEMFQPQLDYGVFGRSVSKGLITIDLFNPRDYATDKHHTVDDKPYGGGPGMVMMTEPLLAALQAARAAAPSDVIVVLMSPSGTIFNQQMAVAASAQKSFIFICGRYEGLDQRFIDTQTDEQWSIGNYVLSGGELPALVVMDALARHIPGVLGNNQSNLSESHLDGKLDYPQYTRPEDSLNRRVPEILLSGDHAKVTRYRRREALRVTYEKRPDLLTQRVFTDEERTLLTEIFADRD